MNGFFFQKRIGWLGKPFYICKLKTMKSSPFSMSTVTTHSDSRITPFGHFLRKFKLDELPQLFNVLIGDMSFVGPRPDVPGFADKLPLHMSAILLSVRPGITGVSSLKYRNESTILSLVEDPISYNSNVIYPDKVKLELSYVNRRSFFVDLKLMLDTLIVFR